ncbi:TetR/AcrR family transcriptional regulator [Pseudorhodoferax sp. LjRoot39]|uniref:TetR/AcrR family transcriptional regulator n=1 Tax=Pseudorhodoferax sp. LjRoot39 TaxID=3342328 RepID=UPI003ECD0046
MPRPSSAALKAKPASDKVRVLPKGRQTKAAIVDAALSLASQMGLEGLSIGAVAELTQMSKSGVFAHFGSREELQISVVREYYQRFEQEVFFPALRVERGLPRLRALFGNWMQRVAVEIQSGCIFISGAAEFDDRPGPVRDALVDSVKSWLGALNKAVALAKEMGELRADTDARQMAFEIHGLILALHYEERFLQNPGAIRRAEAGFEHILARYGSPATVVPLSATAARKRAPKTNRPSRTKE